MVWFFMVPLALLTGIGVCLEPLEERHIFQWYCLMAIHVMSVSWIVTELVILWTKWSKEAQDAKVIDMSYVGDEESRCKDYLSRDEEDPKFVEEDGLDPLDARHLRDEEDPKLKVREDFFGGMTPEELDRYIDGVY